MCSGKITPCFEDVATVTKQSKLILYNNYEILIIFKNDMSKSNKKFPIDF